MKRKRTIGLAILLIAGLAGWLAWKQHAARQAAQAGRDARPVSSTSSPVPRRGRVLQDPRAREALARVGIDPKAEEVWAFAINNLELPPNERQDLIEDLNEEGFADPKKLTPADLPVILRRLDLIEQLAPAAMDEVNAAAFKEAYKDLINMRNRLLPPEAPSQNPAPATP